MSIGNNITLSGNVGGTEPTLRFTPGGQAVTNFSMAVNRRWMNRQTNEWESDTSWVDITAWGDLGENVAESVGSGSRVTVTGRIQQERWDDKETGKPRSRLVVVADDVAMSLKWATAVVTPVERPEGQGGRPQSGGGQQGSGSEGKPAYNADEEPF